MGIEDKRVKAIRQHAYGKPERVLSLEEVELPAPQDDQVLVRVRASSVNSVDCRLVTAQPFFVRIAAGLRRPKDPEVGRDAAGVVEAVGKDITGLSVGDEVFGTRSGAFAEYVAGDKFVRKPANVTFEQAAATPIAAITALQALRDGANLQAGERALINGAGGGVGLFAVQIAKHMGARVTGVTAADKVQIVSEAGADEVFDRTNTDYTRSATYDVIVDCGGDKSLSANLHALTPTGRIVMVGAHKGVLRRMIASYVRRRFRKQPIIPFGAAVNLEDLETLSGMLAAGQIKPIIDRSYPLEQAPAAVAYAETQQAAGKVVVNVSR
jgi:NADPH:quinone reductase-like Zn-dependent oxidoreductase